MTAPVALRCLLGRAGPPELGSELAALLELPGAVQATWAEVMEANLTPVLDDRAETAMKRYGRKHDVALGQLAAPAKACRFLFLQASRAGVDRDAFSADIGALVPAPAAARVRDLLLPIFDAAIPQLRQAAVFLSVADHGRVVRGVRWRVDVIKASTHGTNLGVPVATITLQYQEGPNAGHASYQILPEEAAELRRALDAILE